MNLLAFTGNLGNDCRKGMSGTSAVVNFSVAMKSGYGDKQQTIWVDCALWGSKAEGRLPEFLVKGAQVAVHGEMGTREHEGKTYITCRVSDLTLIGGRQDGAQAQQHQQQMQGYQQPMQQAPQQQYQPAQAMNYSGNQQAQQQYQQAPQQAPGSYQQPQQVQNGQGFGNFDDEVPF